MKNPFLFLLLFVFYSPPSYSFQIIENALDLTYENITLPKNEVMGLVGANYLAKSHWGANFGLGVYGATRGKRGGFFTGGAQFQYQKDFLNHLLIGGEGFLGGGGGGSAPQGGGLMLRGSIYSGLTFGSHSLKLGFSTVSFPNGNIESQQWSIGYAHTFQTIHISGWPLSRFTFNKSVNQNKLVVKPHYFSFQTSFYFPENNNQGVSGKDLTARMDVIGIRYQSLLINKVWFDFETGGALGGGIDGFAQVFTGLSFKHPLVTRLYWAVGGLFGAAGGGDVYTGGGTVIKAYTGIEYEFVDNWFIFTHFGYLNAPGGHFNAATINLNIAKSYDTISFSSKEHSYLNSDRINYRNFRIRPGIQRYSYYQNHSRKSESVFNHPVSSVQLKLDSFISKNTYFTGHAVGAADGKAGGYAVGLVGIGYQILPIFNIEFLFGAAGGGGIDVGNGILIEPSTNVELPLSKDWSIEAGLGFVQALDGKLSSWVPSLGLSYRFSTLGVE